jgi:hypothetical protein
MVSGSECIFCIISCFLWPKIADCCPRKARNDTKEGSILVNHLWALIITHYRTYLTAKCAKGHEDRIEADYSLPATRYSLLFSAHGTTEKHGKSDRSVVNHLWSLMITHFGSVYSLLFNSSVCSVCSVGQLLGGLFRVIRGENELHCSVLNLKLRSVIFWLAYSTVLMPTVLRIGPYRFHF